jgi:hypothetical protein
LTQADNRVCDGGVFGAEQDFFDEGAVDFQGLYREALQVGQ